MTSPSRVAAQDIDALAQSVVSKIQDDTDGSLQSLQGPIHIVWQRVIAYLAQYGPAEESDIAHSLDQAGCSLWNASLLLRDKHSTEVAFFASLRGAAASLLYAGHKSTESGDVAGTARLVTVFSKAIQAICQHVPEESESLMAFAEELLAAAIQFSESLSAAAAECFDSSQIPTKGVSASTKALAEASQALFLARYQLHRRKGRLPAAEYALKAACDELNDRGPTIIPLKIYQKAVRACVEHGSLLLGERVSIAGAVEWLRRAISLLDRLDASSLQHLRILQLNTLRKLARACYELAVSSTDEEERQSHAVAAESALDELTTLGDRSSVVQMPSPSLALLRLDLLDLRHASGKEILQYIGSLTELDDAVVERLLRLIRLRHTTEDGGSAFQIIRQVLQSLLLHRPIRSTIVGKVVLSTLVITRSADALGHTQSLLEDLRSSGFVLDRDAAYAAQSLLLRQGSWYIRPAQQPDPALAAQFYRTAAHAIFKLADRNGVKALRMATKCLLDAGVLTEAHKTLMSCPPHLLDDALNHYLLFVIAVRQEQEDDALRAFHSLLIAPNFQSRMLPAVIQTAQNAGFQHVLCSALDQIASRVRSDAPLASDVNALVLTRSLIKYDLQRLRQGYCDVQLLLTHLDGNFKALRVALDADHSDSTACREADWSYKTAYNAAIECVDKVDTETAASLFDMALGLAKVREQFNCAPLELPQVRKTKVWAKLPLLVARVMIARGLDGTPGDSERRLQWFKVQEDAKDGLVLLEEYRKCGGSEELPPEVRLSFLVLDFEATLELHDWAAASKILHEEFAQPSAFSRHGLPAVKGISALEAMVSVAWSQPSAPDSLLRSLLEATVRSLKSELSTTGDVARIAPWIRALVDAQLSPCISAASPDLRQQALAQIRSIFDPIMTTSTSDKAVGHTEITFCSSYPEEEKRWLKVTAWEAAIELFQLGDYEEAQSWGEMALDIARFCKGRAAEAELQQLTDEFSILVAGVEKKLRAVNE